jgi:hypothetical protein
MSRPTYAEAMLRKYGFSNRQVQFLMLAIDKAKIDTDLTADEVLSVIEGHLMDRFHREQIKRQLDDVPGQELMCYHEGRWYYGS